MTSGDSVIEAQQLFQVESGGAIPTSPHQLKLKLTNKLTAQNALSRWHYLGDKGFLSTYNFGVFFSGELVGIICYGIPNAPSIKGIYDQTSQNDYLELTRLALSPDCPKNSASRVIAISLKLLAKMNPEIKGIITYADTEQGHVGTIYKASNFKYLGLTAQKTDLFVDGIKVGKVKGKKYSEMGGEWIKRSRKHLFYKELNHD